ncbi:MAG: efflux RND transporter permease subunit, partial [Pseudoclavibacter sp.]
MHRLASLSMANRALIALVTAAIAFFGVFSMTSLKQELIPSITLPMVSVITSLPGASPEVVDENVSRPVESSLQGLEGLETTTTTSSANVSSVSVEFEYGTDLTYAQQRIQVALNRIEDTLPDGATTNVVAGSIDDFPVLQLAVVGDDTDEVANLLRIEALGDLLDVGGVRDATLSGAPTPRIAITPDTAQLAAVGASTQDITDTLDNSGALIPVGQLTEGDETLTVQAGALLTSADDIAALPMQGITTGDGQPVTIGDVAQVAQDSEPVASISRVNGEDALTISITKRPDANTVTVSQDVRDLIPELESKLGAGIAITVAFDQAPYIEESIETLIVEGLLGLVFAVLVIFVFLLSVRATLVTAISIPTSLLVTFIGLQAADYSLNILTLGALTISIGRVVDDSIVVIENINRHMAMRPAASRRGAERANVVVGAVREVAGAISASTIATVAVFLPIVFVSDISGELFRPFALTSVIALLASLVVALTIVPVLAYWFLGGAKAKAKGGRALGRRAPRVGNGPMLAGATVGAGAAAGAGALGSSAQGDAAQGDAARNDAMRRVRPSELRAQADRERFSPLSLREDEPADAGGPQADAISTSPEGAALAGASGEVDARAESGHPAHAAATPMGTEAPSPWTPQYPDDAGHPAHAAPPAPAPTPTPDAHAPGGAVPEPPAAPDAFAPHPHVAPEASGKSAPDAPAASAPGSRTHPHLTADDLPRNETGEITLSRRALRELRQRHGSAEVEAAIDEAGREQPQLRPQQEQQQQSRDDAGSGAGHEPGRLPGRDVGDEAHPTTGSVAPGIVVPDPSAQGQDVTSSAPGVAAPAGPVSDTLEEDEPRSWLQKGFDPVLAWTLRRPAITLVSAALVLVLTGLLIPLMQTNFLGDMAGNTLSVTQTLPANSSLEARDEAATKVEDALIATEGVETVQLTISGGGGAFAAFGGGGGDGAVASFSIIAGDDADMTALQTSIRDDIGTLADVGEISVSDASGAGFSSDMTVEITAPTSDALTEAATQVTDALAGNDGIVEATNSLDTTSPLVQLEV